MATNNSQSGGIGFLGLLCIVFIVLKLTNVIACSWGWVLAPMWIPLSVAALCLIIIFVIQLLSKH